VNGKPMTPGVVSSSTTSIFQHSTGEPGGAPSTLSGGTPPHLNSLANTPRGALGTSGATGAGGTSGATGAGVNGSKLGRGG
jgi:hypothetical protein